MHLWRLGGTLVVLAAAWGTLSPNLAHAEDAPASAAKSQAETAALVQQYLIVPEPAPLQRLHGVHPRLYLNAERVATLRRAVLTNDAGLWQQVRSIADEAVKAGPPAYTLHDKGGSEEQLWQRPVGNTMPYLAMAWALTGDPAYLRAAREWALASCAYPTWGLGHNDSVDLSTGHQLFGLAMIYDWCYADLDEATRKTLRETMIRRGTAMFQAGASGRVWWTKAYLQNHQWVSLTGLAAAGLAIVDEYPEAGAWVGLAAEKFQRAMAALGPDGASHEGVGYWEYGVEYLLKYMHLSRELLGVDLYQHPWWRNTASYRLYMSLPRKAWTPTNNVVDIADCPRFNWYGPDYLLRALAHEYRDGRAQWLAEETASVSCPEAAWLNLIWHDPSVVPVAPGDAKPLPTLRHFSDMGLVSARSGWSGEESLVVAKCGPCLGHEATQHFSYDPGAGHTHPDAAQFVVFGNGQWLIRDDGYQPKWTHQHNTLLIDGKGQIGEGKQWFVGGDVIKAKALPKILQVTSTPDVDDILADATAAYPAELGLQRFVRRLIFLKPNVLLVEDDIAVKEEKPLELHFHPEDPVTAEGTTVFTATGPLAKLRIELLTPGGISATHGTLPLQNRHKAVKDMPQIRLQTSAAQWHNVVAFSWSDVAGTPPRVTRREADGRQIFSINGRDVPVAK